MLRIVGSFWFLGLLTCGSLDFHLTVTNRQLQSFAREVSIDICMYITICTYACVYRYVKVNVILSYVCVYICRFIYMHAREVGGRQLGS